MKSNHKKPLVSIITPCYNGEKYVYRFLDSVLNQSYEKIELIFINDGSTDKTEEIVLSYKDKFEERGIIFKYIYQENKGQAAALNQGLKIFKGDYLTWPDSDDFLHKNSIFERVIFLEFNPGYGIVRSNGFLVVEDNQKLKNIARQFNNVNRFNTDIFDDLLFKKTSIIPLSYMLCAKEFLDINPNRCIYESKSGQNYQMLLPITSKCKCGFIDKELSYILVRNDSHSRKKRSYDEKLSRINDVEQTIKETLPYCECEQKLYAEKIGVFYSKQRLKLASYYHDINLLNIEYKYLIFKKSISFYDKLYYFKGKHLFVEYGLKFINCFRKKLLGLLKRVLKI